jgi:hypothetical protein
MPEIGTSSSMSEDGKRSDGLRPRAAAPVLDSTISEVSARLLEVHAEVAAFGEHVASTDR